MNKKQLMVAWAALFFLGFLPIYASDPMIVKGVSVMSKTFTFEGSKFSAVDSFSDFDERKTTKYDFHENVTVKHDFDGDGNTEAILAFQGETNDDVMTPLSFLMFGKEKNGKFSPIEIISGNDYFNGVQLEDVDSDNLLEVIFWSGGGAHYTSLDIYKYAKGRVQRLFTNGSACGVSIIDRKPFTIRIGREKWDEPGWCYVKGTDAFEVWEWDGKQFVYNSKLSTVKLTTEKEAAERYVEKIKGILKEQRERKGSE